MQEIVKDIMLENSFNTVDNKKYFRNFIEPETGNSARLEINFEFVEDGINVMDGHEVNTWVIVLTHYLNKRCVFYSAIPLSEDMYVKSLVTLAYITSENDLRCGFLMPEHVNKYTFIPMYISEEDQELIAKIGEG